MTQSHAGLRAPSPKRKRPGLRVPCSPSPQPSPQGEGEPFTRAFTLRPSLVVVCCSNDGQRNGDCNRSFRTFQRGLSALPLFGERAGVRGNEANSNHRCTTLPDERQRSGDCNRSFRVFQRSTSALSLLGERAGVRGKEANSNHRRTNDSRNCQASRVTRQSRGLPQLIMIESHNATSQGTL
jgi:hypothetical protein